MATEEDEATNADQQAKKNIDPNQSQYNSEHPTIDKKVHKAIKEVTRKKSVAPPDFDFEVIAEETNQETLRRVKKFIADNQMHVVYLEDGSIYFGERDGTTPNGTGFVAVFGDDERTNLEQCYLGNFSMGKASSYGFLIFDKGQGRYAGMWEEGKYHGNGLFKRDIPSVSDPNDIRHQSYDGQWQMGDMSGFGVFKWPSGNVYEGEWLANRRHGLGKITDVKGRTK